MSTGRVLQVMGPVVDVKFDGGSLPDLNNALRVVQDPSSSSNIELTLEVAFI